MNESEQHKPDDIWKKAFDEASEMPPPRVWDAIERRLDKSEEGIITGPKIVPLWDSGFVSWNQFAWPAGIAAAFALLLIGWWSLSSNPVQTPLAQQRSINRPQPQLTGPSQAVPVQTPAVALNKAATHPPKIASESAGYFSGTAWVKVGHRDEQVLSVPMATDQVAAQMVGRSTFEQQSIQLAPALPVATQSATDQLNYGAQPAPLEAAPALSRVASVAFTTAGNSIANESQADPFAPITAGLLASRPIQGRDLEPIQRIVWVSPIATTTEDKAVQSESVQRQRDVWTSVTVTPGSFDPSVSVRPVLAASNAVALNSATGNGQSMVNSRAGLFVAYQAIAGVQLTSRWSVEGGVGYLSGQSGVESPAQRTVYTNQTASIINRVENTGNFYVNALRNSLPVTYRSPFADIAAYQSPVSYDLQSQQTLANNYRFVQVPVQLGFQLRPRKRFGLAVLGGFLTNIFVRNTVGDNVVINSKDGVYRPLSWSATLGARFRYRPTRRWSASLAGLYQTAFGSGTEATSQVQNRLSATGMSFGVDYHF